LKAHPASDLLHVSRDVGEFDAETADAVGQAIDQTLGVRWPGGDFYRSCELHD
jgi:hypothetical protein